MNRDALRCQLVQFINAETGLGLTDLAEKTSLRDGLGLDSLDVTGIVLRIEHLFRIQLTRAEVKDVQTVGQLLNAIEAKQQNGRPPRAAA